jgi:hypothetical protein
MKTYVQEINDRLQVVNARKEEFMYRLLAQGSSERPGLSRAVAEGMRTREFPPIFEVEIRRGSGSELLLLKGRIPSHALAVSGKIVTAEEQAATVSYSSVPLEDYADWQVDLKPSYQPALNRGARMLARLSGFAVEGTGLLPQIDDGEEPDASVLAKIDKALGREVL